MKEKVKEALRKGHRVYFIKASFLPEEEVKTEVKTPQEVERLAKEIGEFYINDGKEVVCIPTPC